MSIFVMCMTAAYNRGLKEADLEQLNYPAPDRFSELREARPRLHLCVGQSLSTCRYLCHMHTYV